MPTKHRTVWQHSTHKLPGGVQHPMDRAYRELGVAPGAPESEVKAAYRKLVLQFHPDRHLSSSPSEQAAAAHRFKVSGWVMRSVT